MILYFSATGNCKYIAERLCKELNETSINLIDCIKCNRYEFADDNIGIISPTYNWGLPSIVKEFLESAKFQSSYLYFISTYGTTPGASDSQVRRLVKTKISAFYCVKMPDTWTPIFDLSSPEKVAVFTKTTEAEIDSIINNVQRRYTNRHMNPHMPSFTLAISQPIYNGSTRKTSHFNVNDSCIGCGLCAKKCPVNAIEMQNKRPVWVKKKCVMCLGCLHRCPRFAIQYGKNTAKHGQYTNPNVKV